MRMAATRAVPQRLNGCISGASPNARPVKFSIPWNTRTARMLRRVLYTQMISRVWRTIDGSHYQSSRAKDRSV
ncbi:hypothetical protein C451_03919 [Halococcus thailandensis JCM 13552]|uniref:Uncharacterized protein n=1 Tax=Halococcus thailandensis JCM 13552 TaxID=1227457 RepID=M0NDU9_9EURY|nr:hypothetical protein C451_03919 [Halococcus thailandensis JCM 13552]